MSRESTWEFGDWVVCAEAGVDEFDDGEGDEAPLGEIVPGPQTGPNSATRLSALIVRKILK